MNTKLATDENRTLLRFGHTGFYYSKEFNKILDGNRGSTCVIEIPKEYDEEAIQAEFDRFYVGYEYGKKIGRGIGRSELQSQIIQLLGIKEKAADSAEVVFLDPNITPEAIKDVEKYVCQKYGNNGKEKAETT